MAPVATEKFVNWITGQAIALFDALGSVFNASGTNHTIGLVPDPGSSAGTTKFLREDATWDVPPGNAFDNINHNTLLGRVAAGTGPASALTGTQAATIIDAFTGDSGAGGVKGEVPAPAAGDAAARKFLFADGTWKTLGITQIAAGNLSGTAVNITNIPNTFAELILIIIGASTNLTERTLVQVSTNNGVSYDTTTTNYVGFFVSGSTVTTFSLASLIDASTSKTAAQTDNFTINIRGYQGGPNARAESRYLSATTEHQCVMSYIGSTNAINALQITNRSGGTFDAGTYALYGVN